jgi:LacI family transcriptional regulator
MYRQRVTTIRDVARAAKLSPAAVSRYLNGDIILPKASASRIDRAVRELNYQPNRLARNLSLGQSKMIGLIIPDISNPFFATLACAVEDIAFKAGYGVLLCNTQNDRDREFSYLRLLSSRQLDGILFLTSQAENPELAEILQRNRNVVLIDEDVPGVSAPRIFSENRAGAYLATRHLLDHGHKRIAFIGGPRNLLSTRERFTGFENALKEHGLRPITQLVRFGPYTSDFGRETALRFFEARKRPTAIFASSDYVALGVLNAAHGAELEIPGSLSLIGFDDMPLAELLQPPLTTVRQSAQDLGREGAKVLLNLIAGEPVKRVETRLPVQLITRGSVRKLSSDKSTQISRPTADRQKGEDSTEDHKEHKEGIAAKTSRVVSSAEAGRRKRAEKGAVLDANGRKPVLRR